MPDSIRDLIVAAAAKADADRERDPVTIAGQAMFVTEMSAAERDAYEFDQLAANELGSGRRNFRARLLVRVLVDDKGERLFTDGDVETLGKLKPREIRSAFDAATKLNQMNAGDRKAAAKK